MERLTHWLEGHLLSCPAKALTGMDCPGCGLQRSVMALLRGDVGASWDMYPPLLPLLCTLVALVVAVRSRGKYRMQVLAVAGAVTVLFVVVNFVFKLAS